MSNRTLDFVARLIRRHRAAIGSRWRRFTPGRQALLVLAHLRNGDTYQRLASGFGLVLELRVAGRHRDPHRPGAPPEAVLLHENPPSRHHSASADRTYGRLAWVSDGLPGSVYDLTAAREHGVLGTCRDANEQFWNCQRW